MLDLLFYIAGIFFFGGGRGWGGGGVRRASSLNTVIKDMKDFLESLSK